MEPNELDSRKMLILKAIIDDYIDYLAHGVANIINVFQPAVVCIGGGISAEGEELTQYFSTISRFKYSIAQFRMVNSPESPFFFVIETK